MTKAEREAAADERMAAAVVSAIEPTLAALDAGWGSALTRDQADAVAEIAAAAAVAAARMMREQAKWEEP